MKIGQVGPEWAAMPRITAQSGNKNKKTDTPDGGGTDAVVKVQSSAVGVESKTETEKVLKMLAVRFPDLAFRKGEAEGEEAIRKLAQKYDKGGSLILSEDFLEWMAEGGSAWEQGMTQIREAAAEIRDALRRGCSSAGAVLTQNAESYLWEARPHKTSPDQYLAKSEASGGKASGETGKNPKLELMERTLEQLEEMREKRAEQLKKQSLLVIKKKLNYRMGRDMAKLSKVSQDRFVRSFISGVYARKAQINGGGYDKKEKAAAMAQMDYVIRCAKTKIRHLKEERQLEISEENLREAKEEKKRLKVERELKERRTKRKSAEHARIFEDLPDLPGLRSREEQKMAAEEFVSAAAASGLSGVSTPDSASGTPGVQAGLTQNGQGAGGTEAGGLSGADITVSTI